MKTRRGRAARSERGVAVVELALIVPFLAMIVFGTIDLGRAYQLQNRLHNAAREGARLAQFAPQQVTQVGTTCADPDNITWAANHEEGTRAYTVTVKKIAAPVVTLTGCTSPQAIGATVHPGDRVRVEVSTTFTPLTPLASAFVRKPLTVTGSEEVVVQG